MKCHFLTFSNTGFMDTSKIVNQSKELNVFDSITVRNEYDILNFINKHAIFIKTDSIGFGRYIWKPKIILDMLNDIDYGDVIVYCDAGMCINTNGRDRFLDYLKFLDDKSMCVFSTTSHYKCKYFVKSDAVMSYFPEFVDSDLDYVYAGCMMIKKTDKSIQFIREWLELCENYHYLDRSPSFKFKESPEFKGQDTDNGLFGLCVCKFNRVIHFVSPYEINVYNDEGIQLAHLPEYHYSRVDWSSLDKYPFQYHRNTSKYK